MCGEDSRVTLQWGEKSKSSVVRSMLSRYGQRGVVDDVLDTAADGDGLVVLMVSVLISHMIFEVDGDL